MYIFNCYVFLQKERCYLCILLHKNTTLPVFPKWWVCTTPKMVEWVGGLHPIWDMHIWWFLLDRKHICHFYVSNGCIMVENGGVSLFRNVTGWSFPWAELSAVVLLFGQSVPSFRNVKIQFFWCLLKRNISFCFTKLFYDMPFWRKDRWTDTLLLLCIECSYLRFSYTLILVKNSLF